MASGNDLEVSLRIKGDGSGLSAVLKTAQGDLDVFAAKAKSAGATASSGFAQMGAAVASGSDQAAGALTKVSGAAGGVTRELAVMTGELVRGNFTRLISSTTVLANRMGLLAQIITSPLALGFAAVTAGLAYYAIQSVKAQQYTDALNKSIAGTGGYTLQSAASMKSLSDSVNGLGVKSKDAQAEVLALGSSGKFAGDQLSAAVTGAANLSVLLGVKISEAGKEIEKLGDKPLQGLIAINNQTHLISLSAITATASAEAMGNKFLAVSIATDAVADATAKAIVQQKQISEDYKNAIDQANGYGEATSNLVINAVNEAEAARKAALAERDLNAARNLPNLRAVDFIADLIPSLQKEIDKVNEATATYGKGKEAIAEYTAQRERLALAANIGSAAEQTFNSELKQGIPFAQALADSYKAANSALATNGSVLDGYLKKLIDGSKAEDDAIAADKARKKSLEDQAAAAKKVADEEDNLRTIIARGSSSLSAIDKASETYNVGLKELLDTEANFNKTGKESEAQLDLLDAAYVQLNKEKQDAIDKANAILAVFYQEGTALDQLNKKYADSMAALQDYTGLRDKEVLEAKAAAEAEKAWAESIHQAFAAGDADLAEWIKENHDGFVTQAKINADLLYDATNTFNRIKQVRQDSINIFSSGLDSLGKSVADFATGTIKNWSDFGKSLVDDTKQFIAAIIEEFLKLEIFNGIINSLFGLTGTSSELATFANLGAGSASASGGGGILSMLGIGASGSSLLGGSGGLASSGAIAGGGAYTLGSADALSSAGAIPGGGEYLLGNTASTAAPFGGTIGGFSTGGLLGAAGGALYGSTLGSGGISTGVSTITGAVAGYAVGAAVTTAMTAGISAGLAAVPVVGWIALAALVVDKVSGGKLFGTKFQTQSTDTTISLDASGGSASASETQTRQKALFGGKETRVKSIDAGSDADAAAQSLYDQEKTSIETQATLLGKTAGDLIAGTFDTITTYTKKGAVASTKTISEFLGKQYTEDATAFAQRYAAENTIALIDQGDSAQAASKLADQYRSNAATLLDAAQTLFAVDVDLKNGNNILNEQAATLTDSFTAIQKYTATGETLLQTYARLQSETQNLNSLYLDTGNAVTQTGDAFVGLADDLAKAFGGVANEGTALAQFIQEFGAVGNGAVNQMTSIWDTANKQLVAIGETAGETTAQFARDFAAALPTLTPDQIAAWVAAGNALYNATTAQEAYNTALRSYQSFSAQLGVAAGTQTSYEESLVSIDQTMHDNIDQANKLAQAAGLQGASELDLANIHSIAAQAAAAALAQLEQSTLDLIGTLGLSTDGTSSTTAASAASSFNDVASSASKAADAAKQLYDAQIAAIKQVHDFLNQMLLDTSITTLTPQQRLDAAATQYQATLTGAEGGNTDDLANLTKSAQDYLDAARTFYSSSDSYTAIFNAVRDGLSAFANTSLGPDPGNAGSSSHGRGSASSSSSTQAAALSPLQMQLNLQALIGNIHDLLTATGTPLKDLVSQLHLNLPALAKQAGIKGDGTLSDTEALANLAGQLGVPVTVLAQQLGQNIGDLTDQNSLDARALQDKITKLPSADASSLQPYFDAIKNATNSANSKAAIAALTAQVNTLPEAEKEALAPFLDGVQLDGPLDYLTDINDSGKATAASADSIDKTLKGPVKVTIVPGGGTAVPPGGGGSGAGAGTGTGTGTGVGAGGGTGGPGGHNSPAPPSGGSLIYSPSQALAITASVQSQTNSATQTTRALNQILAEIRAMRADTNDGTKTVAGLDKVASKLDNVIAAQKGTAQEVARQTDTLARGRR